MAHFAWPSPAYFAFNNKKQEVTCKQVMKLALPKQGEVGGPKY